MYEIRTGSPSDSGIIQQIAQLTWPVAYGHILSGDQLQYMLGLFYSEDSLTKQMTEDGHRFLLLLDRRLPIGFASFSPKRQAGPGVYRLHKLYVLPEFQGKGAGKSLLEELITLIRKENAISLELNVNRFNQARFFYEKNGFRILREEDIDIGSGYFMNDYVMIRDLHSS